MAQRLGHARLVDGRAHHDADPGAREQQVDHGEHGNRDAAHEHAIEGIRGHAQVEGREVQRRRDAVVHREIAEEQLDQLGDDERQAKGQQQLVRVAVTMDAAQEEALHRHAGQPDQDRRDHDGRPEADGALQRVGKVGAQHVERRVGKVEHAHHAEDEGQASGDHEQQQAVDGAVKQ